MVDVKVTIVNGRECYKVSVGTVAQWIYYFLLNNLFVATLFLLQIPVQNHRPLTINFVLLDEEGRKFDNFSSLTVRWTLSDKKLATFVDKTEDITFDGLLWQQFVVSPSSTRMAPQTFFLQWFPPLLNYGRNTKVCSFL